MSAATISNVEAGRPASLDVYARLVAALGLDLDVSSKADRRVATGTGQDLVHSAMGELEAAWLQALGYEVAVDHPYQHYQFAGRADVLAWTLDPPALLHIENRTQFPDIQAAAGSYNAKRRYLARSVTEGVGIPRFLSETHVMAGLWSAEVAHRVRIRGATFRALCPGSPEPLAAWLRGVPPRSGRSSCFVLLDPFASGRRAPIVDLDRVLRGVRPRMLDYREAAERLRAARRT